MLKKNDILVTLENAGIEQNSKWLVRGVNLTISRGEIVTLIGPNGSGKSTTAKMTLGILPLSQGIRNVEANLNIAYVPQKLAIDWTLPLSVERFMHLTSKLTTEEVVAALSSTKVLHLKHEEVRTLSGGEFQRVMLARAIVRKPDLLVLDEPVQGVDFAGEIQLYELIKEIRDQLGCGILLISHDLHMVMAATDKVICLNGHVCCEGTPSAVTSSKEYKQLFGERASPTLAVYEHQHDHTHLPDGTVQHADGTITDHCHPDDGHHHGDAHEHSPSKGNGNV